MAGRAQLWQLRGNYELKGERAHLGVWINASLKTYTKLDFQFPRLGSARRPFVTLFSPLYLSFFTLSQIAGKNVAAMCLKRMQSFRRLNCKRGKGVEKKKSRRIRCDHSALFTFSYICI